MLSFLPAPIKGGLAALLILFHTLLFFPLLLLLALVKLVVPLPPVRKGCTIGLNIIASNWASFNNLITRLLHNIHWDIRGVEHLTRDHWYFVTCNHQSWTDIPAIQFALNRRIPMLRFFLKKELIWVPLLGVAWWALDFPFMHRYSREQIARRPELRGKDLEATRLACEKYRHTPVTVFNFMEGTRLTPAKQAAQKSPYKHLLKPKAGGSAFVLGAMGDTLHTMLDITIVYPGQHRIGIWDYLCGRITHIIVDVQTVEIPPQFLGMDYQNDRQAQKAFITWVADLWSAKDQRIEQLKSGEDTQLASADNRLGA
ncbi:acyltransferase [Marinobacter sp. X15-166B]|uniref:acyltransferase n=1 Tax=Marinobacter sp. X15-166B TaxID=1897620 RepID=UPI00085C1695|nr:acyltransferase [Marinobacter sp. X15-166B]OEY65182.1 acyltransferase [Marinobacter sp. X15-166B]